MSGCPVDAKLLARLLGERTKKSVPKLAFPQNVRPGLSGSSLWLAHIRDDEGFRFGVLKIPAPGKEKDVVLDNEGFNLMKAYWLPENLPRQHFLFRHRALVERRPDTAVTLCSFADEHCVEDPIPLSSLLDTDMKRAQDCLEAVYRCYEGRIKSIFGLCKSQGDSPSKASHALQSEVLGCHDLMPNALDLGGKVMPYAAQVDLNDEEDEVERLVDGQFGTEAVYLRSLKPQAHMRSMIHPELLERIENFQWHRFHISPYSPIHEVDRAVYPNSLCALTDSDIWKVDHVELVFMPIHGDLNPDNIVVLGDGDFVFVDFEKTRYGVPQYDLAFLLMWLIKRLRLEMIKKPDEQAVRSLSRLARSLASSFGSEGRVRAEHMGYKDKNLIQIVQDVFVPMTRMVDITASPLEFQRKGARLACAAAALVRCYYELREAARSDGITRGLSEMAGHFYYDLSCCVLNDEGLFDSESLQPRRITVRLDLNANTSQHSKGAPISVPLELIVFNLDGIEVRRFRLQEGENRVGVRSQVTLPDIDLTPFDRMRAISRRHAVIAVCSGKATVRDLDSANGTKVDGTQIGTSSVELTEASDIAFADIHCRIGTIRAIGTQVSDG